MKHLRILGLALAIATMNIKYLRVALVGLLLGAVASCVNYQEIDQEACGGDVNCIAQRQQTRVMATGMMMQYNQNQQLIPT